jgi:hypothetical protein
VWKKHIHSLETNLLPIKKQPFLVLSLSLFFIISAGCGPIRPEFQAVPEDPGAEKRFQAEIPEAAGTAQVPATGTPNQPSVGFDPTAEVNNVMIRSRAEKISQIVGDYDRQRQAPTGNLTNQRYRVERTDLGIPFQHRDRTYLLFGDAWNPPDDPIAYTTDTNPEDGLDLVFLQNDAGRYRPIQIPGVSLGAFEVPTEGISVNGRMFIYVTTDHTDEVVMGRSAVAVSDDDGYTFNYLYDLSGEHFINVSLVEIDLAGRDGFPAADGAGLIIFGSGRYRESDLRLAFQPAEGIENPEQIQYFTGLDENNQPSWSSREEDAPPLFDQPCIGEFSVSYNAHIEKWILLYNCGFENARGINLRTANRPWGPWSDPLILFHPWDDRGYCHFMHVSWEFETCDDVHDGGRQNEWGGEYGPYQFENLAVGGPSQTTIYFTMSTWNPYTVVLMKATLEKR